jgi:hypothetical protein
MSTQAVERRPQLPGPTNGRGGPPAPTRRRPSPLARRIALVVAALATVAGLKLVTVGWLSNSGVDAYERKDYGAAQTAFERLSIANVTVQRWVAPFDLGVARAANDDLTGAESAFRTALRLEPARCETRFNLAATIEAIGDDIQGGASNPVARQHYEDALAIAEAGVCDPETEPGHRLAQLIDRLRQKLSRDGGSNDQATSAADGLPSDRQPEADSGQFASSNQSGQIEQRNMAGASERRDRQETITLAPGTRDRTRW